MPPRRSTTRKRQTKLSFSPTTPSPRAAKKRALSPSEDEHGGDHAPVPPPRSAKRQKVGVERGVRLGMPVRQKPHGMFGSSDVEGTAEGGSGGEEEEVKTPARRQSRRRKRMARESEDELVLPRSSGRKGVKKSSPRIKEESGSEVQMPRRRRSKRGAAVVEGSDDDDGPPRSQRRRAHKKAATPEEGEGEEEEGEEEGSEEVLEKDDDDERLEEDDLKEDLAFLQSSPPPDKGRLRSTQEKPKNARQRALEALKQKRAGTGEPPSSATSALATPGRKRPVIIDSESDSDSSLEVIEEVKEVVKSEEDSDDEGEGDEDEHSEEDSDDSEDSEPRVNASDIFREKNDDAEFIDDDDDAGLGDSAHGVALPIEFSGLSRAKPRELFKYAVEWMVKKKINPAFPAMDEIYDLAFRKLSDEVTGLANSKYSSSVWTPDFTRAIKARPDLALMELGPHERAMGFHHCEACNRKQHPASYQASLTGKPYNKETLEPLGDDSDSDSDSDGSSSSISLSGESETELNGEKPAFDATGERIPPESKSFYLGSTCKANAQMSHTLLHWKYHLNSWVVDYLVKEGHCTPEKLVKRDKWSTRKREKYANKIVDEMEAIGEIKKLHKLYKEQVTFALEANNDFQQGWGRR